MKSGKGNQEEEEEDAYEDFVTRKDAPPPTNNTKDGKNSNKANAVRSKHSVTEQRRRSKINERFKPTFRDKARRKIIITGAEHCVSSFLSVNF
ncbi:transcription factor BIM2-like isoform X2 [Primulina tabacum]|uniref:transcription factor BIM2-like isoform X2 n=1 Tax=Primulina tabacum TaxID=48773 RepID=UPI003F59B0D1